MPTDEERHARLRLRVQNTQRNGKRWWELTPVEQIDAIVALLLAVEDEAYNAALDKAVRISITLNGGSATRTEVCEAIQRARRGAGR